MNQMFANFSITDAEARARVVRDLEGAGFATSKQRRAIGEILAVRYRDGTSDEAEVVGIIGAGAPGASRIPNSSPSVSLSGYREGLG